MTVGTSWIMIKVIVDVRESSDSRRFSHDIYDDLEIITRDTKEELLAHCYGVRKTSAKYEPESIYGPGQKIFFYGPLEVTNNQSWTNEEGVTDHWFDDSPIKDADLVHDLIESGSVLYQILK